MRKILATVALAGLFALAGSAAAAPGDMGQNKGDISIGWFDYNAPVAIRYLASPKLEVGGGFGFNKPDEGDTGFALAGFVNFRMIEGSRACLGIRPRFFKEFNTPGELMAIGGDLVVEVKVASAVSVIAGHGIEFLSEDTTSGDSVTTIQSRPVNGASVGFWVKLP